MPDHFSTLTLPRRPWLEPEAIKDAFHRLAAAQHPDAPGGDAARFAATNTAWQILREPATRLRHLLELEFPAEAAASAQVPADLAEIFMRAATLRQSLDGFLQRKSSASSALERALLAEGENSLSEGFRSELTTLDAALDEALESLRVLDATWHSRSAATATHLAALQLRFAFLSKWTSQLREALFQLGG